MNLINLTTLQAVEFNYGVLPAGVFKASLKLLAVVFPQLVVELLTVLQFIDKTLYWQKYIPFLFHHSNYSTRFRLHNSTVHCVTCFCKARRSIYLQRVVCKSGRMLPDSRSVFKATSDYTPLAFDNSRWRPRRMSCRSHMK